MNVSRSSSLRRLALASATLVVASAALTGCALDFIPDAAGDAKADSTPKTAQKPQRTVEPTETQEPDIGDATGGSETREAYAGSVERTVSCPGGTLEIADISSIIALDSDCIDISVTGSGTVLLANSIDRLTVVGVDNAVFVKRLGSLDATGHGNVVTWESGSPTVSNTGINNELNPAG